MRKISKENKSLSQILKDITRERGSRYIKGGIENPAYIVNGKSKYEYVRNLKRNIANDREDFSFTGTKNLSSTREEKEIAKLEEWGFVE